MLVVGQLVGPITERLRCQPRAGTAARETSASRSTPRPVGEGVHRAEDVTGPTRRLGGERSFVAVGRQARTGPRSNFDALSRGGLPAFWRRHLARGGHGLRDLRSGAG